MKFRDSNWRFGLRDLWLGLVLKPSVQDPTALNSEIEVVFSLNEVQNGADLKLLPSSSFISSSTFHLAFLLEFLSASFKLLLDNSHNLAQAAVNCQKCSLNLQPTDTAGRYCILQTGANG